MIFSKLRHAPVALFAKTNIFSTTWHFRHDSILILATNNAKVYANLQPSLHKFAVSCFQASITPEAGSNGAASATAIDESTCKIGSDSISGRNLPIGRGDSHWQSRFPSQSALHRVAERLDRADCQSNNFIFHPQTNGEGKIVMGQQTIGSYVKWL